MKRNSTMLLLLFLISSFLKAGDLTMEDCLNKALAENPSLEKARKSLNEAVAKCFQGYANFLPTLSIGGQLVHLNDAPPPVDFTSFMRPGGQPPQLAGNPLLQYAYQDNYTAYFRINEQLFTGGRNLALLSSYKAEYRSRKADLKGLESRVHVDVYKAFFGIIIQNELKELAQEAVKQLKRHLDSVKDSFKAGSSTEYEVLRTEVQLLSWTSKLTKSEKDLVNSYNRLALLLGTSLDATTKISGELTEPSSEETAELTLEQARAQALKDRPEIEAMTAMKDINNSMKKVKISSLLPQINFQYNYYYQNKDDEFTFQRSRWEKWWDLRLNFSWEIFSFGKHAAEIRESVLKKEGSEIDIKSLEDRITAEVDDSYGNLSSCRQDIEMAKKNLDLAKLSLQMAKDKSKTGTATEIDVLDSEVALIDARVQYLKSLYEYKIASAEFQRVLGR